MQTGWSLGRRRRIRRCRSRLPAALIVSPTLLEIGFGPGLGAGASAGTPSTLSQLGHRTFFPTSWSGILKRLPQAHVRRTAMIAKTREKNIKVQSESQATREVKALFRIGRINGRGTLFKRSTILSQPQHEYSFREPRACGTPGRKQPISCSQELGWHRRICAGLDRRVCFYPKFEP